MPLSNSIIRKSTSKFKAIRVLCEDGKWRSKIISQRVKFDDDAKQAFLEAYKEYANIGHSCNQAGISITTYHVHLREDEDFAEGCILAERTYQSKLLKHHQDLIFKGTVKRCFDRNGNLVSEETTYPIRLIEMELKKHDAGYRDKRELDVIVSGGVMVAPPELETIAQWEERFVDAEDVEEV